jgi:HTH-type transcriptional regulator / antitoxin HipB
MDYALKTTEQLRQQLRSLRKKQGLTQAHLGALIGVTQARVVEIEANPGSVSLQQVMQVLHALGAGFVIREVQADSASDERPDASHPPGARARVSTAPSPAKAHAATVPLAKHKKGSW